MRPDAMPDHVGLAVANHLAVGERRPPVVRPGQLVETPRSLNALHAKSLPEASPSLEIAYELLYGSDEQELPFSRKSAEVLAEPRQALIRGQRVGLLVVNVRAERS